MDQYNNHPQNNEPQEIDIIDLVVVLWRRKLTIVLTTVLGMALAIYIITTRTQVLNVSAVFFVGQAAVITEEASLAEALAGKKEGIATELLMELSQSQTLLGSIYLPRAISKHLVNTEGKYLEFASNISIEIGDQTSKDKSQMSSKVIRLSATTTEELVSDYKAIIDNALTDLADMHNQVYERHQDLTKRQIISKTHELNAHLDSRVIASGKQPLLDRQLSNQISQREHKDESLNKQIDLRLQRTIANAKDAIKNFNYQRPILAANRVIDRFKRGNRRKNNDEERIIVNMKAGIDRVRITLDRLDVLVDHQTDLRLELVSNLRAVETDRSTLRSQLGSKNNTSTLITEAINAVDSRIARYESKISEIDQQLHVDLPTERLLIEKNIESLSRKLVAQKEDFALAKQAQKIELSILEEDLAITKKDQDTNLASLEDSLTIAMHNERVSKLNRSFTQEKLDNATEEIKTAIAGHNASFESKTLRLNSAIEGLEVVLNQSVPSEILARATARPEKPRSPKLSLLVIVMLFGAIGLFFAFFLELLDKAQSRIEEKLTQNQ
jgi:LPS O-antigen subunit length determinant protein (WzzB/FepE family)